MMIDKLAKEMGLTKTSYKDTLSGKLKRRITQTAAPTVQRMLEKKLATFTTSDPEQVVDGVLQGFGKVFRPMQNKDELAALARRVKELQPRVFVEIGTAMGGSLLTWTRVLPDDALIITIDLPGGEFGGGYPEWRLGWYQAFERPGQTLHLLRADSHTQQTKDKLLELLDGRAIDALFLDGDHSYDGIKSDFEMYAPLVRPGGIIGFHDITPNPSGDGGEVPRFWNEIHSNYEHEAYQHEPEPRYGIGVLTQPDRS